MKRPFAFVAISWWLGVFFLALASPIARSVTGYRGRLSDAPGVFQIVQLIYFGVVVAFLGGFVQMRTAYIWIGTVLSGLWTLWLLVRIPWLAVTSTFFATMIFGLVSAALCGASAIYLARPQVRDIAARFRAENERAAKQRQIDRVIQKTGAK